MENKYETFSVRENHWNFFPGWKTLIYSCRLWDSNPRPPSNSVVVITPRLAHRPNLSATELWYSQYHCMYWLSYTLQAIMKNLGKPFWELPPTLWDDVNNVGLRYVVFCMTCTLTYWNQLIDSHMYWLKHISLFTTSKIALYRLLIKYSECLTSFIFLQQWSLL